MKKMLAVLLVAFVSSSSFGYIVQTQWLASQRIMSTRANVHFTNLDDTLDSMFYNVYDHLDIYGVPAGYPFTRTLREGLDGVVSIEAGVMVSTFAPNSISVQARYLPSGRVAITEHVGAHEFIDGAYTAIERFMYRYGYFSAGAPWEVYLNDPETTPSHLLRTLVYWPISGIAP